jgi:hypothetical protein
MPDLDATFEWLSRWQPLCFDALRPLRGSVMDFRFLRRYSHGARRVFSADRWAMTGEAGVFLDPFYSPGSDFIGISNGFITELVRRDLQGKPDAGRSRMLEELYLSFYRSCLDLYLDQYPGFGDLRLMACKTTWDYAYYWGVLARLYFAGALADEGLLQSAGPGLLRARRLNQHLQEGFRQRAAGRRSEAPAGRFVDQCAIPCLRDLNAALPGPADGAALSLELDRNLGLLHRLADALTGLLEEGAPPDPGRERALVGDLRSRLAA